MTTVNSRSAGSLQVDSPVGGRVLGSNRRVRWYPWARVVLFGLWALGELAVLGLADSLPPSATASTPALFSGQRAFDLLGETVEQFPNRVTGSPADDAASAWVGARLVALGLDVTEDTFETWGVRGISPV